MSTAIPTYPFDPDGIATTNKVHEQQTIQSNGAFDYFYIIPKAAPFFQGESLKLKLYPGGRDLIEGKDYALGFHFMEASHTIGLPIYGAITFYDHTLQGIIDLEYQTLGGTWTLDEAKIMEIIGNEIRNPRITSWETVTELPQRFPVVNHSFDIDDFVGMKEVETSLEGIKEAIEQSGEGGIADHISNKSNPHEVTKTQVGLGLVDNYPTAALAEAQAGLLNNRFMTPAMTKAAIDALAISALNAHAADKNNPHEVSKAQVGLGLVQNFGLASQAEAEIASSNARYMTPVRTREAIMAIVGNDFEAHEANTSNPHQVNKAQVGLGNVPNLLLATDAQAQAGTVNDAFMTPLLTRSTIMALVGNTFNTHRQDFNNPHQTTKTQVGLGNVPNYPIATEAQAQDATDNATFMTPYLTRKTIAALVGEVTGGHTSDYSNPHRVTAAQVGAYSKTESDTLLAGKLGTGDKAIDSLRVFGFDQAGLETRIRGLDMNNALKLEGRSFDAAMKEILAGKAADSALLNGKTLSEIQASFNSGISDSKIQFTVPQVARFGNDESAPQPNWTKIGSIKFAFDVGIGFDTVLMLSGGRNDESFNDDICPTAIATISAALEDKGADGLLMGIKGTELRWLVPADSSFSLAYRVLGASDKSEIELWVYSGTQHERIDVTELTFKRFTPADMTRPTKASDLITTRPTGLLDFTVVNTGKGLATTDQALAGTSTTTLMSPKATSDVMDAFFSSLTSTLTTINSSFS